MNGEVLKVPFGQQSLSWRLVVLEKHAHQCAGGFGVDEVAVLNTFVVRDGVVETGLRILAGRNSVEQLLDQFHCHVGIAVAHHHDGLQVGAIPLVIEVL